MIREQLTGTLRELRPAPPDAEYVAGDTSGATVKEV
jgi:hypothetical protein